jgi:hypothetical protein
MPSSSNQLRVGARSVELLMALGIVGVGFWALVAINSSGWVAATSTWLCVSMCFLAIAAATITGEGRTFLVVRTLALVWLGIGAVLSAYLAAAASAPRQKIVACMAAGGLCSLITYATSRTGSVWHKLALVLMVACAALLVAFEVPWTIGEVSSAIAAMD